MFKEIIQNLKKHYKVGKQSSDWDEEKIKTLAPLAEEVLKIVANNPYPHSSKDNWEEVSQAIRTPVKEILDIYRKHNILLSDMPLVNQLVKRKLDRIEQSINDSLNHSSEFIESQLYGCPKRELDFKTLHAILLELDNSESLSTNATEKNEE